MHENTNYPFVDDAKIPPNFLDDIQISCPNYIKLPIYLTRVYISKFLISVLFSDADNNSITFGTYVTNNIEKYTPYPLKGVSGCSGSIAFNDVNTIVGQYNFKAELIASTVNLIERGNIDSINGLSGDVKFKAGTGVYLKYNWPENALVIGLQNPESFVTKYKSRTPLYSVNKNPDFEFQEDSSEIISIATSDHTITLYSDVLYPEDLCSNSDIPPPGREGPPGPKGLKGPSCRNESCD